MAKQQSDTSEQEEQNRLGSLNESIDNYTTRGTTSVDISGLQSALKTMFISSSDTKNNVSLSMTNNTWTTIWEYTAAQDEYINLQGWINYAANATGARFASIRVGAERYYLQSNMAAGSNTSNNAFYTNIDLKVNETITLEGYQSSGGSLTTTATFYFKKINI